MKFASVLTDFRIDGSEKKLKMAGASTILQNVVCPHKTECSIFIDMFSIIKTEKRGDRGGKARQDRRGFYVDRVIFFVISCYVSLL